MCTNCVSHDNISTNHTIISFYYVYFKFYSENCKKSPDFEKLF